MSAYLNGRRKKLHINASARNGIFNRCFFCIPVINILILRREIIDCKPEYYVILFLKGHALISLGQVFNAHGLPFSAFGCSKKQNIRNVHNKGFYLTPVCIVIRLLPCCSQGTILVIQECCYLAAQLCVIGLISNINCILFRIQYIAIRIIYRNAINHIQRPAASPVGCTYRSGIAYRRNYIRRPYSGYVRINRTIQQVKSEPHLPVILRKLAIWSNFILGDHRHRRRARLITAVLISFNFLIHIQAV